MVRKASGKKKAAKPGRRASRRAAETKKTAKTKKAARSKRPGKPKKSGKPGKSDVGGAVSSTAKLLDATALAKMVVSQLEGAVRAVAMSMLRSRDGSLQAKYEQLSLDGQLEILATVLEQAAEIAEATDLTAIDRGNEAQVARARSLVPVFGRLESEFKRLRQERKRCERREAGR